MGEDSEYISQSKEGNFVGIGWKAIKKDFNWMKNELNIEDINLKLKDIYAQYYPSASSNSISQSCSLIIRFVKEIKIGDIILVPDAIHRTILIGEITGDYTYKKDWNDSCPYQHRRTVKWINEVARDELSEPMKNSMGASLTVFSLKQYSEEIQRLMEYKVVTKEIPQIRNYIIQFKEFLKSNEAKDILSQREKEKIEVKELMKKLQVMDKKNPEFTDLVLYGLLPYFNTKFAKRVSIFPVFFNIKLFLKGYNYSEEEWNIIANRIFTLCNNFWDNPKKLQSYTDEFSKDKYNRMIQTSALTPIFYCLNNNYHLVNNPVRNTYRALRKLQGYNDRLSRYIKYYPESIKKLDEFAKSLNDNIFSDKGTLDLFCFWFNSQILTKKEKKKRKIKSSGEINIEEIDFHTFIGNLNFDVLKKYEPPRLDDPERIKIRDIIKKCSKKKWVLPQFQRYFDWNENDIQEFLNSIFKDYYVGSFLLWETSKNPELGVMPIKGIDSTQEMKPDSIILDGQQRITSLYYAIKNPDFKIGNKHLFFYLNFSLYMSQDGSDMLIEKVPYELSIEDTYKRLLFPLNMLENYDEWEDGLQDYLNAKYPKQTTEILEIWRIIHKKLHHIWDGYEIPYVSLSEDIDISQVTDIFEGINTKGKPLGIFDLLIARLYKDEIELKKIWDSTLEQYPQINEYYKKTKKMPVYIFQSLALAYTKTSSCKRKDILDINKNMIDGGTIPFEERWWEIVEYINRALDKLTKKRSNGFGAKDAKELPFVPMIPIIASLIREIDNRENKADCYKKIDIWYWCSVFSNAYSSAVDSTLTSDFRDIKHWFDDDKEIPKSVVISRREFQSLYLQDSQSKSGARYKGVMSILTLQGSKDFITGQTLEDAPKNEQHHLFPKSIFKRRDINSVLNMAWMSKETNRIIHNHKPSVYIPKFISQYFNGDEKEFLDVLKTHMINKKAYHCLKNDDFEGFIQERENLIKARIGELIGIKHDYPVTLITPTDPFDNKILYGETIESLEEYIYWIDKYFSVKGLKFLKQFVNTTKVSEIKILMSIEKADEKFRSLFKDFKTVMENNGINTELRIITDLNIKKQIHDRWILSKYQNYNIPSPDIIARGQYSEIKKTDAKLPFNEWWNASKDI